MMIKRIIPIYACFNTEYYDQLMISNQMCVKLRNNAYHSTSSNYNKHPIKHLSAHGKKT